MKWFSGSKSFGFSINGVIAALLLGLVVNVHAQLNHKLSFIKAPLQCIVYDGGEDDLLTSGLGKSGLQGELPKFKDDSNPTAAELRRRAIYINYQALVDITENGGYGELYGPNIDVNSNKTLNKGMIAGEECLAFADDGSGQKNVTMMVQIPATFDPKNACIVAAPSSGSRSIYVRSPRPESGA